MGNTEPATGGSRMEPLTEPPAEPEGDDTEAGGGEPASPTSEGELADTPDLDDEDYEDDDE